MPGISHAVARHAVICTALLFSSATLTAPGTPANIRTDTLANLLIEITRSAPASVVSHDHSMLSAQLSGVLLELRPQVGDRVSQGQLLARIDCNDYRLSLNRAQTRLEAIGSRLRLARERLRRIDQLHKRGNASTDQRDQRRSEVSNLTAEQSGQRVAIRQAQLQVARCDIHAPFDALVTERPGAVGSLATPGSAVVRLLRNQIPEVQAQLPPAQLKDLQASDDIWLQTDLDRFPLQLRTALDLINTRAHTREVRLTFSAEAALPGATGRLLWKSRHRRLPAQYLLRRQNTLGVMLFQNGRTRFYPLPDAVEGQSVRIDLPLSTAIVTEGQHGLNTDAAAVIKVRFDAGSIAE